MKYIGVADVRNPHADAWGHGGISCRPIPIYRGLANETNAFICPLANTKWADTVDWACLVESVPGSTRMGVGGASVFTTGAAGSGS